MNPVIQFKRTTLPLLIALTFACFGPLPITLALLPPPDGGYPNGNTAEGDDALLNLTSCNNNTAIGLRSLSSNTTGNFNIALGPNAGDKLTTGANNIDIGNRGVAGEADTIRIGDQQTQTATFIAGIIGAAVAGPVVHINSSGQLGVPPSSARFKDEIKPMDKASEAILALKPVTFHYKHELDPDGIPQF